MFSMIWLGKFAGLDLGCARHQAFKVVGDFLLLDGALQALLHQVRRFVPAQETQHHHAGKNHRAGIDHILVRILRRGSVGGFKAGVAIADIGPGRDPQPAHLGRARVRDVVSVQIGRGQHRVFIRPRNHLLEDGVGDAVIDHELFLPRTLAVGGIDRVHDVFDFLVDGLPEVFRGKFHAGLDQRGILFDRKVLVFVFVVQDPALALGHHLVAKFFCGQFISPLAECAFGKFLDVSLVHQGHALAPTLEGKLDGHAHQALGAGDGDRLDAHSRIQAHLFFSALQHFLIEELDQARHFRGSLLPFDAGIDVFGVLAIDHDIHAFRMLHRRGHALVVLDRSHAGIKIENLAQGHVQRPDTAAHRRSQRPLDGHAEFADGIHAVIGEPGLELGHGLFAGKNLEPHNSPLAPVSLLHRRIEHPHRRLPDIAARAVALDERNNRIVRNLVLSVAVGDPGTGCRHRHTVVRSRHYQPSKFRG